MIFAKAKQKKNLLEEFKEIVLKDIAPQRLIDNIISPYADAYMILKSKTTNPQIMQRKSIHIYFG